MGVIIHVCNTGFEWLFYNEDNVLCEKYDSVSDLEEENMHINPQLVIIDLISDPPLLKDPPLDTSLP